jgi:hypothetical protein
MKLGKLDLFRHRDQDVLKVNVHSPDLEHVNNVVKKLPNSFSFPNYNPHVTVAYLKPGTGEKYLSLKNPLEGRETTLSGLVFSTPEKHISYIPLRAHRVEDIVELAAIGYDPGELIEMTTAMAVGTQARPFGFARPVFPSSMVNSRSRKPASEAQPWGGEGGSRRRLVESNGVDAPDYRGLPYHLQVMDHLEGHGWEHIHNEPRHSVFTHENHPDYQFRVLRSDQSPVWELSGPKTMRGDSVEQLKTALIDLPYIELEHDDD